MERHLSLNGRDTSLIWTYSEVGCRWCFHSQSVTLGARTAFTLYRAGTALATIVKTSYTWFSVHNDEARKRERGIERLRKRQATTPHRPVKRLGYSRRSGESMAVFRTPQMAVQLGHFQLLKPRGKYKCVYSAYHFPSLSISRSLSCSRVVN